MTTAQVLERTEPATDGFTVDPLDLFRAGFIDLTSVIPPGVRLKEGAKVNPDDRGKARGKRNGDGTWSGLVGPMPREPATEALIGLWQRWEANFGLRAARFPGLDIDVLHAPTAETIAATAEEHFGWTATRTGRWPKRLLIYRTTAPFKKTNLALAFTCPDGSGGAIEFLGDGQQYVVAGTHPATMRPYTWDCDPSVLGAASLPEIDEAKARAFLDRLATELGSLGCKLIERGGGKALRDNAPPPHHDRRGEPTERQRRWLDAMLDGVCADIRTAPNGSQYKTLNGGALRVGHYVAFVGYDRALAALVDAGMAMVDHDRQRPWRREDVESKVKRALADGMKEPKAPPDRPSAAADFGYEAGDPKGRLPPPPLGAFYTGEELEHVEFPPPEFVVENLVAEGLSILAGRPKLGKSWLMLGLSHAVATGGHALDKIPVDEGDVLYAALEDTPRRMQSRLRPVCRGERMPRRLTITHQLRRLDDGGLDQIKGWLEEHPAARLVTVDTWGKVKPAVPRNANAYDHDYAAASALKKLADESGVAIVLVHHLRKAAAEDVFDEIGGSVGLTAAADSNMVLKRERSRADAVLHATGRDIEEQELALKFEGLLWSHLGDAAAYRQSRERVEIVRLLGERPGLTPKEIAEELGRKRENVRFLLGRLLRDGFLVKDGDRYRVSASAPEVGGDE